MGGSHLEAFEPNNVDPPRDGSKRKAYARPLLESTESKSQGWSLEVRGLINKFPRGFSDRLTPWPPPPPQLAGSTLGGKAATVSSSQVRILIPPSHSPPPPLPCPVVLSAPAVNLLPLCWGQGLRGEGISVCGGGGARGAMEIRSDKVD